LKIIIVLFVINALCLGALVTAYLIDGMYLR
jgi:hypothetical protein